jgi:hypothetical protein
MGDHVLLFGRYTRVVRSWDVSPEAVLGWVRSYRELLVVVGLAVTVSLLVWVVRRVVRGGRVDRWLAGVSLVVGFAWSGEAMWEVATQRLGLSPVFAGFAFFLFESQMATAMLRAERSQARCGGPGRQGRAVWLIAVVAGGIAAVAGGQSGRGGVAVGGPRCWSPISGGSG